MPRPAPRDDDYEDDDPEAPGEWDQDADEDDDADTVDCPGCGRAVSELAERCPRCGTYLSEEDAPRRTLPTWVVITAVVLLAAIAMGWLGGVF
jgi:uncharacterized paraquat-inducible protein A